MMLWEEFMPGKKYRVKLTDEERDHLEGLISRGTMAARKANHARILLHADEGSDAGYFKDEDIADVLHVGRVTVERVRKRFVEEGLESALNPKPRTRHRPKKLDGEAEAFLVATACSAAPDTGVMTGRCSYWRIGWLNVKSWIQSVLRQFDKC